MSVLGIIGLMRKSNLKALGQKIKKIRRQKSLLQVDLAVKVGISSSYVGAIEQGQRYPSLKVLEKVAKALRTPLSSLLE